MAKSTVYWHAVAQLLLHGKEPIDDDFKRRVVSDFSAMIPDETGLRDPRVGVWPLKLVKLCDKAPTQKEWIEIAHNYRHREMAVRVGFAVRPPWHFVQAD